MSAGITLKELLVWNEEASNFWKAHFDANPHLLELECGIGGAATVQEFVCHIWGVELRWSQRLAGLPVTPKEDFPAGPLDALFDGEHRGVRAHRLEDLFRALRHGEPRVKVQHRLAPRQLGLLAHHVQ